MIHQELLDHLVKNLSSVEIDTCLYSLTKVDWNNNIHSSIEDFANHVGTTKKYMREVLDRLTSHPDKRVFKTKRTDSSNSFIEFLPYRNPINFNPFVDRYSKKYSFFYSDSFKGLSLNAKRLLLIAAFEMSVSGNETFNLEKAYFYKNTEKISKLPLSKKQLLKVVSEINELFNEVVTITVVGNVLTRRQELKFQFKEGTLSKFVKNNTERFLLRKNMYIKGVHVVIDEDTCIGIEKVAKSLYRALEREEKKYSKLFSYDEDRRLHMLQLARSVYNDSIDRFSKVYASVSDDLDTSDKVSAYFSAIVHDVISVELAKSTNQAAGIQGLLEKIFEEDLYQDKDSIVYKNKEIFERKKRCDSIEFILMNVCENWVQSRMEVNYKNSKEEKKNIASVIEFGEKIIRKERTRIERLISNIESLGLKHVDSIRDTFDFYFEKLSSIKFNIHATI